MVIGLAVLRNLELFNLMKPIITAIASKRIFSAQNPHNVTRCAASGAFPAADANHKPISGYSEYPEHVITEVANPFVEVPTTASGSLCVALIANFIERHMQAAYK
jgi:hypothetical protein